tara:strand:- start:35 stop:286 length:252 start_codon:yes stop_codon:yes gene_type:complete
MKIDQRTKKSAYIELDNGLTVYVDTSTGENIIKIWERGEGKEFQLIDGLICFNTFPSDFTIYDKHLSSERIAKLDNLASSPPE